MAGNTPALVLCTTSLKCNVTSQDIIRVLEKKIRLQLAALDTATVIEDMDLPGYNLHPLKGQRKDCWSIVVNGNWRITFEFENGDAYIVNYEDYH